MFPRLSELPDPEAPHPGGAQVHASSRNLANFAEAGYWQKVCPGLHLNGKLKSAEGFKKSQAFVKELTDQINSEGVVQVCVLVRVHGTGYAAVKICKRASKHGCPPSSLQAIS